MDGKQACLCTKFCFNAGHLTSGAYVSKPFTFTNKDGKVDMADASAAVDGAVKVVEKVVQEAKTTAKKVTTKKSPAATRNPRATRKNKTEA